MAQYKMVVLSRPVEGREAEYHDWYQNVHLGEVVAFDGFKSAQRLRLSSDMTGQGANWPYAALYDIETDDLDALLLRVQAAAADGRLTMSDALHSETAYAAVYETFGAPVTKAVP